jgi:hypothetical protein
MQPSVASIFGALVAEFEALQMAASDPANEVRTQV